MDEFVELVENTPDEAIHQYMLQKFKDPLLDKYKPYQGTDGISFSRYSKDPIKYIRAVKKRLLTPSRILLNDGSPRTKSRFTFTPFLKFDVPKHAGSSETRPLCKASISSIIGQRYIAIFLKLKLENDFFIAESYAYRPNKSAKQAIQAVQKAIHGGYNYVLDADIRKFFDTVDHDILLKQFQFYFPEQDVLHELIRRFLKTGYLEQDKQKTNVSRKIRSQKDGYRPRTIGIPQGGILSGMLSNLYLHALDCFIKNNFEDIVYIRYADDFVIFSKSETQIKQIKEHICIYLLEVLKLQLHPKKTFIRNLENKKYEGHEPFVDFLGYRVTQNKVKIQAKNIKAFQVKMKEMIANWEAKGKEVQRFISMANTRMRGRIYEYDMQNGGYSFVGQNWTRYFSLVTHHGQLKELDDWLAREMLLAIDRKLKKRVSKQELRQKGLMMLVQLHYKMKKEVAFERKKRQYYKDLYLILRTKTFPRLYFKHKKA